jgi:hypothetical protein
VRAPLTRRARSGQGYINTARAVNFVRGSTTQGTATTAGVGGSLVVSMVRAA